MVKIFKCCFYGNDTCKLHESISLQVSNNIFTLLDLDVSGEGLSLMFMRWATKKTAGSTKNGRDSKPKNLGVKKFGGEVSVRCLNESHDQLTFALH